MNQPSAFKRKGTKSGHSGKEMAKQPSVAGGKATITRYWFAVVGTNESLRRLASGSDGWWCLPATASPNDRVAYYCARGVSERDQGVFALGTVIRKDPTRQQECSGFGDPITGGTPVFFEIRIDSRHKPPLTLKSIRLDAGLRAAKFVRRNCQGTIFDLAAAEWIRLCTLLGLIRNAPKNSNPHLGLRSTPSKKKR